MKKWTKYETFAAVSLLLIVLLFALRKPLLSAIYLLAACVFTAIYTVKAFRGRLELRQLLPAALLTAGVNLFDLLCGYNLSGFGKGLPALLLAVLLGLLLWRQKKLRWTDALKQSLGGLTAAATLGATVFFMMNVNARVVPKVRSLREGHDAYLEALRGGARTDALGTRERPNVLLIMMDDMGYGDLSLLAETSVELPNLEALGENGVVMEQFYSSNPACSPSRFGCLTGRYAFRGYVDSVFYPTVPSGDTGSDIMSLFMNSVLFPNGVQGMLGDEITLAEALQAAGYATGAFGKWHLGDYGEYLPNAQGFDYFYGFHYSNDMKPYAYYRNDTVDRPSFDQKEITRILTDELIGFIDRSKDGPFFAYYASPRPHDPVSAGDEFRGTSKAGLYGDCLEEFDAGLGEILAKLEAEGILEDTLILFTSDNGPWFDGSAGGLRGRKNNTFNGGHQVPFIASHPSLPRGARLNVPAMNIDLFPTILAFCGIDVLPEDRPMDGVNILPLLTGEIESMDRELFFISGTGKITGILQNEYKYFEGLRSENAAYITSIMKKHLYRLDMDRREAYNVYDLYPEQAQRMAGSLEAFIRAAKENPR